MDNILKKKIIDKNIFDKYEELLKKWQKAINLVSPKTIDNLLERHFYDSLYLYDFIKDKENVFDIGSGAGFPAMVLSIAGREEKTFPKFIMVEADERKCFFLQEIKRAYNLKDSDVEIKNIRIEDLAINQEDKILKSNKNPVEKQIPIQDNKIKCITGRAFAPLNKFLDFCKNIIDSNTEMYLLKGDNIKEEIKESKKNWDFEYTIYKKENGVVIKIWNIEKNLK